ncbi:hypothetical protein GCM10011332_05660 [Terasakiella brassicae]|uniref:DUF4347 domain-containing protein n=2 Tax=Terasakiella brassicae TaxID=1634917 RepID=A0A917BSV6_9PROT|nr:hypothetical protein GCM10011332_05660 [Terasakiella brassicae]
MGKKPLAVALEQRFMFDAAGVATGAEVAEQNAIDTEAKAVQTSHDSDASAATEIYFIDSNVADYDQLIAGLGGDAEYVVLNGDGNGLDQMAAVLSARSNISAVHVLSHGGQGEVLLGTSSLSSATIEQNRDALEIIGQSLSDDGDILLYGCNIGTGSVGATFIGNLADVTGADIAASDDATGASGDWALEAKTGQIEAALGISLNAQGNYQHDLATFDFTTSSDNVSNVTSTVSGITVTITSSEGAEVGVLPGGGLGGTSGNLAVASVNGVNATSMTFSFSSAVNLTSLRAIDIIATTTANWTFTPNTGSAVTESVDHNTGTLVDLSSLTGITSFTITSASPVSYGVDTIIFEAAPTGPSIDSATYDAATGTLVVTGTNLQANAGGADIDASKFTITGEGEEIHVLNNGTANVELGGSTTQFTLTLSAADKAALNQIMNKNGTESTNATPYNVAVADGWNTNVSGANDLTGNGITVSNVAVPQITSATYDIATNQLVVTGTNFLKRDGATNDIDVSKLTFKGEGDGEHALTSTSSVEITDGTTFTVTLSATDAAGVEALMSKNGTESADGKTYNLAAAEDWAAGADSAVTTVDGTSGVTVSNYNPPVITAVTYNYNTNQLVVTGTNFVAKTGASNDIDVGKLSLTGEGGTVYPLTSVSDVEIDSATQFTITLSGADLVNVESILNQDGTTSALSGDTFNLAAAENWMPGAFSSVDIVSATNVVTVSNYAVPEITSATYDWSTGVVTLTGTNFVGVSGATNDITVANKFTFTGEDGTTYTLSDTANVDVSSATTASFTLSATDKAALASLMTKNGTSADSGQSYNLAAAEDWMAGAPVANNVVDATTGITVSNYVAPAITSATYDAAAGTLVVTGTNLQAKAGATNDIDASKITITGEGGETHVLNNGTANVEIDSATQFTLTLSAADKAALNQIMNKNGTESTNATLYKVAAADGWNANVSGANDLTGNGVTVSNVAVPQITSAAYDYSTNVLTVTGTSFLKRDGAANDIDVSKLTITGEGGATYTLSTSSNVEITNGTTFSVTLSGTDIHKVEELLNKNGTTSATPGTTFNLAGQDTVSGQWAVGADTSVNTADMTGNVITVSNYEVPQIASATYDWSTGQLVLTGTNFVGVTGANNDIDVTKLTITGEDGATYELTSSNVDITSSTTATVTLNAADKLAVHGLLNKNGTSSDGATLYNISAAEDWIIGAPADNNVVDATTGITVSNYAAPTITAATYDSDTGVLTVTGTNFVSKTGANNDIDISTLTFTGGTGNATYDLSSASDVEITSATSFTVTLTGVDKTNVDALLDQTGTSSSAGSTYNIAAADNWLAGGPGSSDIADTDGTVTVSVAPAITSATYDAAAGTLVVTGTNLQAKAGATNDIDASKITITGEGGETHVLNNGTANVEIDSATQFTLTLSAADKAALNQIMNKNGTESTNATSYNVAVADGWNTNVSGANDLTGNTITVSNVAVPQITSATYDIATNQLVVTGTNFLKRDGATNDIDVSKLTFKGEGDGEHALTSTSSVEITDGTTFTVTLSATDAAGVEALMSKNGTESADGKTYNLAAAEDWAAGADSAVTTVDGTSAVTVSNYNPPVITAVTYNYNTNQLVVTGTNFVAKTGASNDIDVGKLSLTGEGGTVYPLTSVSDVEIDSATQFTITLSGADLVNVESILNKDGTTSALSGDTFNLAAAEDWMPGAFASVDIVDATNVVTVSNYAVPEITGATYDMATGVVTLTGTNFVGVSGATNDITVANKFTFTGEDGTTYTLNDTANVDVSSATTASFTLSATDKAALASLMTKNGTSADSGQSYNLAAAEDWMAGAPAANNVVDATTGITVSNYVAPAITSATYDAAAGTLVVTGTNLQAKAGATNDIDASKITITGEGGETHVLNNGTANVEIDSATQFTLTLSAADKAALNQIMNKNGTESTNATLYKVAAADGWNTNVSGANDLTGNGITVSNVAVPEITSAAYDYSTNVLTVTGTSFLKRDGAANDIDVSKLTFKGEGGATYTLTSASDVEITNGTTFTITLSATDAAGVEALTSKNGTSAANGTTYNLAAAEDWAVGADSAVTTVDGTSGVTVSNYNAPAITSVAYDYTTGTLALTGTNFVSKTGAANDIDVSLLSLTGQGNTAYTLTDSADVEITSATSAVITLSATDKLVVNGLLNKDGTTSATGATTFNLGAADNWMTGAFASVDIVDATNAVTVSNYAAPEITSATYDITTKTLVVSGTNFVNKTGAANDVDVSQLTLTGKGAAGSAYTLTSATDVEITSATEFTLVLNETDAAGVAALLDANGTSATDGQTYNLAAAGSWLAQVPVDISDNTGNGITVSNVPISPTSSGLNVSQIGGDEGSSENTAGNEGNPSGNDGNGPVDNGAGNVNVPAGEVNFGNSGDRTTWNEVVSRGGSSSSVIGDPSAGVEGMTIVRNAVTGNDAALNSFYGTGRVSSSNSGGATVGRAGGGTSGLGAANPGLSGLAGVGGGLNGLANGGGLGGGFGGGLGGGFGGLGAGDTGFGGFGAPENGVGQPDGFGNSAPAGESQSLGDEAAPGGEQAFRVPQGGRMNFSAQLVNASGAKDLKVVKALLEAV